MHIIVKAIISAIIIVALSELAKRLPVISGLLAAMPLTTLLVILWVYIDTQDIKRILQFSTSVLWALIPTAFFFIAFVIFLKKGIGFWSSLAFSFLLWAILAAVHSTLLKGF